MYYIYYKRIHYTQFSVMRFLIIVYKLCRILYYSRNSNSKIIDKYICAPMDTFA